MIQFEWDPGKAKKNQRKHHVRFKEAATVFGDPTGITMFDPDHSEDEECYITIGCSTAGRLLMVAHTDRGDKIRISARDATHVEREAYEKEIQRRKG